jgi:hypothetical protein
MNEATTTLTRAVGQRRSLGDDRRGMCRADRTQSVEPAESLAQRTHWRQLGHQGIEVQIQPNLDGLGGDDEQRCPLACCPGLCPATLQQFGGESVAVVRARAAHQQHGIASLHQQGMHFARQRNPVDDYANHGGAAVLQPDGLRSEGGRR